MLYFQTESRFMQHEKSFNGSSEVKKPKNDFFLNGKVYHVTMTKQSKLNNTVHLFCAQQSILFSFN